MNISQLKELIKETYIDLVRNDPEIRQEIVETLLEDPSFREECVSLMKENVSKILGESVKREPEDLELMDNLVLIAQGKVPSFVKNGKRVKAPNYGLGFKSKEKIEEWANKAYDKLGGKWSILNESNNFASPQVGLSNDTLEFMSAFGGAPNNSLIAKAAQHNNERLLKEEIKNKGSVIKTDQGTMDITNLLLDTAKTTLLQQPMSHDQPVETAPADTAAHIVAQSKPEEMFGKESANNWSKLAFFDQPNKG